MHDAANYTTNEDGQIKSPPNTAFSAFVVKKMFLARYFIINVAVFLFSSMLTPADFKFITQNLVKATLGIMKEK